MAMSGHCMCITSIIQREAPHLSAGLLIIRWQPSSNLTPVSPPNQGVCILTGSPLTMDVAGRVPCHFWLVLV
jgi:hypothetical protein